VKNSLLDSFLVKKAKTTYGHLDTLPYAVHHKTSTTEQKLKKVNMNNKHPYQ